MNNLKNIMLKKGITALQLAETSGLAVTNIRRIMNDTQATPYHKTAEKLAAALNCTVAQIYAQDAPVAGDKELLRKRVEKAVHELRDALRDYAEEPAHFHLAIFTHEEGFADLADYWGTFDGAVVVRAQTWYAEIDDEKGPK